MQLTTIAAALAVAIGGLAALAVQQHRFSITDLSAWHWRRIRRAFDALRSRFFTVDAGEPDLVVDAPVEEVRVALGEAGFTNSWELSFAYEGEDLNMRRPVYVESSERPWQQDHVRGFDRGDGTVVLDIHRELEPTEYPAGHLNEEVFRVAPTVGVVIGVLEGAGFDVRPLKTCPTGFGRSSL